MWERGEARPGRHYRRGLTEFTGLTEADLGFGLALPFAGGAQACEEEADTNRREMISSMVAAGVALSGFPLPARTEVPDRVGPQHVAELRRLTEMYRTWIYSRGADRELQRGVTHLLDRATTLIGQASAPQLRCDLLDATADSAGLAAYACRDLGQHEWAQRHYLIAMQAAHAAGDHALAGHLVVRMAGHNIELAQPKDVLTYLAAANQAGRRAGSPTVSCPTSTPSRHERTLRPGMRLACTAKPGLPRNSSRARRTAPGRTGKSATSPKQSCTASPAPGSPNSPGTNPSTPARRSGG
jgi:hypothetical protein